MCCRYWTDASPELRPFVEAMNRAPLMTHFAQAGFRAAGSEARPTDVVPVLATSRSGGRAVFPMKWGFSGCTLLINARVETAAEKPTFREAWTQHRCIVPANGYFEWTHPSGTDGRRQRGDRYRIHPAGEALTWMCGLYRLEAGLPVLVILTREASEEIRFIHDRMPLILPESLIDAWIRPDASPETIAQAAPPEMLFERA